MTALLAKRWPGRLAQAVLVALGLATVVLLLAAVVGTGINDYTTQIRVVTEKWLRGETRLFDQAAPGYYNVPWSVWLFVPTTWFSPAIGQAMLNTLSLLGVLLALYVFGQGLPFWIKALAAAPFWVFMLMLAGNLDGVLLLGFCLSWWAAVERRPWRLALGLWLATLKPVNALPLLLFVVLLTWRWAWRDKLKALSLLLGSLLLSFPIFGFDWPLRYVASYRAVPPFLFPIVTVWKLAAGLGITWRLVLPFCALVAAVCALQVWRRGPTPQTFALVTAGWMLVTPYALDIHYVLLVPAFLVLARHSRPLAVAAFVATFTPLFRVVYGFAIISVDLVYPLLLWAGVLLALRGQGPAPSAEFAPSRTSLQPPRPPPWLDWIALPLAAAAAIYGLGRLLPISPLDFDHYYAASRALWQGHNPYGAIEFFAPPWMALLMAPLLLLPARYAASAWILIALAAMAASAALAMTWLSFSGPRWARRLVLILAALAPPALFVYITGQAAGLAGLGALLSAWLVGTRREERFPWLAAAGFVLATLKPHVVAVLLLLAALELLRRRSWRALGASSALLAAGVVFGFLALPGWPLALWAAWRGGAYLGGPGLVAAGYRGLGELGVPFWVFLPLAGYVLLAWYRRGLTAPVAALALPAGLLLAPYNRAYDQVVLALPLLAAFALSGQEGFSTGRRWLARGLAVAALLVPLAGLAVLAPALAAMAVLLVGPGLRPPPLHA